MAKKPRIDLSGGGGAAAAAPPPPPPAPSDGASMMNPYTGECVGILRVRRTTEIQVYKCFLFQLSQDRTRGCRWRCARTHTPLALSTTRFRTSNQAYNHAETCEDRAPLYVCWVGVMSQVRTQLLHVGVCGCPSRSRPAIPSNPQNVSPLTHQLLCQLLPPPSPLLHHLVRRQAVL
jgi:hypothetical protein